MFSTSAQWTTRYFEFRVGGTRYMACAAAMPAKLASSSHCAEEALITVISTNRPSDLDDDRWWEKKMDAFRELKDDVWSTDFLEGLLIVTSTPDSPLSPNLTASIQIRCLWHICIPDIDVPVLLLDLTEGLADANTNSLAPSSYRPKLSAGPTAYMMAPNAPSCFLSNPKQIRSGTLLVPLSTIDC